MDLLQKIVDERLKEERVIYQILQTAVEEQFDKLGIKLKTSKLKEVVKYLQSHENGVSDFQLDEKDIVRSKPCFGQNDIENLSISITDSEINEISERFLSKMPELYATFVDQSSDILLKTLRRKSKSVLVGNKATRRQFAKDISFIWGKPIDLLEFYISLVVDAGTEFNQHYGEISKNNTDVVYEVLLKLFARSCLVASEILTLLRAGFADGAHARWRTLHEIAVVTMFISENGKDVAERYLKHEFVEDYKGAKQYQELCPVTKNIPIDEREFKEIKKKSDDVISQYGSDFRNDYGWASQSLNNKNPKFSDIEKSVKQDGWRPNYKLASHNVHANPTGISFKLGKLKEDSGSLLIGSSIVGLDEAGEETAISLSKVVGTFLLYKSNLDSLTYFHTLNKLKDEVTSEFIEVAKTFEEIQFLDEDFEIDEEEIPPIHDSISY